jgi:hypothetical protein
MNRKEMTRTQGNALVLVGVAILVVAMGLALYSVPDPLNPSLPSFPVLEARFPLVGMLLAMGTVLAAMGAVFPRGTVAFLVVGGTSVVFVALGLLLWMVSIATAVPEQVGDVTLYVEPYGVQALMPIYIGVLLGLFDILAYALSRSARMGATRA